MLAQRLHELCRDERKTPGESQRESCVRGAASLESWIALPMVALNFIGGCRALTTVGCLGRSAKGEAEEVSETGRQLQAKGPFSF